MANRFLALRVPDGEWRQTLHAARPDARWTHPDDLHLTLAFLGPVTPAAAEAAWAVLLAAPPAACTLTLGPLRRFGGALAIEPTVPELVAWMTQHRPSLLAAANARPDHRPPRPHISIARPRRGEALWRWAKTTPVPPLTLTLTEVALYDRGPHSNPRYVRTHTLPLAPAMG